MRTTREPRRGFSLAKGPVALIGLALLAYGITAYIFGGNSFTTHAPNGVVNGETWLGLETNGWTDVLFAGAGLLLLLGAPAHWGAKTMALLVAAALGAACVISLLDSTGDDVFGIFAANPTTSLVWGIAAAALLLVSLLPRVGRRDRVVAAPDDATVPRRRGRRFDREREQDVIAEPEPRERV